MQNCAAPDVAHNTEVTLRLTREAAAAGAKLIGLPACVSGDVIDAKQPSGITFL